LDYQNVSLFSVLDRTAAAYGEKNAIYFYGRRLTYRQLAGAVNKFANALIAVGLKKGDRVVLMSPNTPQYVIAFFGIMKAGGIVVQANPLYVEDEIEYLCNNSGAMALVVPDLLYPRVANVRAKTPLRHVFVFKLKGDPVDAAASSFEAAMEAAPHTDPGVAVTGDDVAVLQYTGGTTGVSKGAMLTHKNLVANALQVTEWFLPLGTPAGEERILTVLPLFHVYGMTCCMTNAIFNASEMILLPKFDLPEVMQTIKATQPTAFPGVPTMYVAVNAYPGAEEYGVGSIRTCFSGGAAMPVEVMKQFEKRFGAVIVEGYGLSEASPVTHCNPLVGLRKPGSIGVSYPDTDCRIVDVETGTLEVAVGEPGELIIRGPQVMQGYWNMPEETKVALREFRGENWLYTGDIARMDEDGYFYITDRKKDMIIVSGFNVYPRDVEEALYRHPAVQEAVVAGVPDEYRIETVKAYVVVKAGQSVTAEELDAHCRQHLAAFKVPRLYEFRALLPKSAVGKVLRRVLVAEEKQKR
jgi:long-chain acyl-CoA synthetase